MKIVFSCLMAVVMLDANTCHKKTGCIDVSKIDSAAACTREYLPVCGCDGITYGNKCEADKHGVTTYTDGPCKTQ